MGTYSKSQINVEAIMLDIFVFLLSNYILVVLSSIALALAFNYGKKYDNDEIINMIHTEVETKNLIRELIIPIIFIVTTLRIKFMYLSEVEIFQYFAVGTLGTLLFRTIATNIIAILKIVHNDIRKNKIKNDS